MREIIGAVIAAAAIIVGAAFAVFLPSAPVHAGPGLGGGGISSNTPPAFNGGTITLPLVAPAGTSNAPGVQVGSNKLGMWEVSSTRLGLGGTAAGRFMVDLDTGALTETFLFRAVLNDTLTTSGSTATNAGSGSCTTVTVSGTAIDFSVTATCTAAQTVVVTLTTFSTTPKCTISSANAAAGAVTTGTPYQSAGSATSATFTFPAVTAGIYNVHCIG